MTSTPPGPADRPRPLDPLESALDAAWRGPGTGAEGLEARILDRTTARLTQAGRADSDLATHLSAGLVPPGVVPRDLAARVHAATVGALPAAADRELDLRPAIAGRIRPSGRVAAVRTLLGHASMAASFALLAGIGWWIARPATMAPGEDPPPVANVLVADLSSFDDVTWAGLEAADAVEAELALLDDWNLGGYAEVAGEIESIIPDFLLESR